MGEPERWQEQDQEEQEQEQDYGHQADELRYKSLFMHAPISLWEKDMSDVRHYLNTLRKKGVSDFEEYFTEHPEEVRRCASLIKIVNINDKTLQIYEADNREQFFKHLPSVYTDEALGTFKDALLSILSGQTIYESETINKTLTGKVINVAITMFLMPGYESSMQRMLVAVTDITGQKSSEKALKEQEQRFRSLIDAVPSAVIMLSRDHKILEFNPIAEKLYEARRYDVIGKDYFELFLPEDVRKSVAADMEKVLEGKSTLGFENPVYSVGGAIHILQWYVNRLLDSNGCSIGVIVIGMDITERKKSEGFSSALHDISIILSSAPVVSDVIGEVAQRAASVLGADGGSVLLKRGSSWQACTVFGLPERFASYRAYKNHSKYIIDIADKKQTQGFNIHIENSGGKGAIDKLGFDFFAAMPLSSDKIIGAAEFFFKTPRIFSESERNFLNEYSSILSISIQNARNYQATKAALDDARTLSKIASKISHTLELNQVLETALSETLKALGTPHGCIYVMEKDKLVIRAHKKLTKEFLAEKSVILPNEGCAGEAASSREMFAPGRKQRAFVCMESKQLMHLDCLVASPIVYSGETLGILELFAPVIRRLSSRERQMVGTICDQLASAIQNSRMFAGEKNIAKTLQEALLQMPLEIRGIDFGYLYRSASAEIAMVGGDFFELFEIADNKVAIVIGDVSGKGLEAATLTSLTKNTIRAYTNVEQSPGEIMSKTSELIKRSVTPETFVTAFLGVLDVDSGKLSYCNAGHPPGVIKEATGDCTFLKARSPAIGVYTGMPFVDDVIRIDKGDSLILYTDGITEARHGKVFFGDERLIDNVQRLEPLNAKEIPERIINEVTDFTGGKYNDDLAILAVSRT